MTNQTNNSFNPQIIVVQTQRSIGVSILLALLFGSLGLFYSTVSGGLIMTLLFTPGIAVIFFSGHIVISILFALLYYPICIIWGIKAVKNYNQKLINGEVTTENFDYSLYDTVQFILLSAFSFCAIYAINDMFL